MARRNRDELPLYKRWASAVFFGCGVAFILLFVYGPTTDGRSEVLKTLGSGLIFVGVLTFTAINLPTVDWSSVLIRFITALLSTTNPEASAPSGKDKAE